MKRTLLATALTFVSTGLLANSFQQQTNFDYAWGDILNADLSSYVLSHQFYLAPVTSGSMMPLAEAGFLSRSSSLLFGYEYNQFDFGNQGKSSLSGWRLGGEYRDAAHNFYASVIWTEINNGNDRIIESSLGAYLDPTWLVTLDIEHLRPDGEGSVTQYGISTKKLMTLAHGDFISVEANYMDLANSSFARFGVAADYYFGRNLSLGLAYDWITKGVFNPDADAFTVRGQWYLSPNLALRAGITFDSVDTGDDLYTLGASFRF